ncbi:MAG: DUF4327 family protein [Cyanobacteriota bacterium]
MRPSKRKPIASIPRGSLCRSEAISHLQLFFPQRERLSIPGELERQDCCPSNPICDLLNGCEEWRED